MFKLRNQYPKNEQHFAWLLGFCQEVIAVCHDLGITPILSGSLAVFAYTQHPNITVNDIDLACTELEFPRLSRALSVKGMICDLKEWHVLQVHQAGLKVEFDAVEYWLRDLPKECNTLNIDGYSFNMVSLATLKDLYRRGLEATAAQSDERNRTKYTAIAEKYELLCSAYGQDSLVQ